VAKPPRVSDNPEVQSHYVTQAALIAALVAALRRLWPSLDPTDVRKAYEPYKRGAAALVAQFSSASISLSADYFEAMREQAGISTAFRTPVIDPMADAQIQAYIDTTTRDFLAQVELDAEVLNAEIEAAAQAMVLDAGRNELLEAIERDTEAKGWARVTKPGACAFCLMLAIRGPVYSRETVGFRAHTNAKGGATCRCTAEPLFGKHYEAPAHIREAGALWDKSTNGFKGRDAINEFRRAVEGRSDGPRRGEVKRTQTPGFDALTVEQLRKQVSVLEGLKDSDYKKTQLARVRARLAELGA
jgi:hypothetical protein